jgi:hypothetical protein
MDYTQSLQAKLRNKVYGSRRFHQNVIFKWSTLYNFKYTGTQNAPCQEQSVTRNPNYVHTRLQFRPIFEAGVFLNQWR